MRSAGLILLGLLAPAIACGPGAVAPPATRVVEPPPAADPVPVRPPPPALGFRMPDDARPIAYRVTLILDPAKDDVAGEGEIDLERGAGDVVYLRAHELTVSTASMAPPSGGAIPLEIIKVDDHTVAFRPADPTTHLPSGATTLRLTWTARVSHGDSMGIFGQKTDGLPYLYTQFEPLGARRAFPSFDEPAFKVPWQLTLVVPKGQVALSNTPVESQTDDGAVTRVVFAPTPPLPSYLIAFAVGPFELLDAGTSKSGAPIRVAVPKGHAAEATIPVEDTAPILALLEDYFGTPFPYAKLDLVPIPDTIGFGAMENAGMITYNAGYLLSKPDERTYRDRRSYAYTAAHEMAHQWFGDLVTMVWWDDLWLNEAFASWMGDRIVHAWKPEWNTDVGNVASKSGVMSSDSRETTRRIREPVANENDVEDAFDGITYTKGQMVIEMIERWLGPDVFQTGVRRYLDQHKHGSATYADLLAALKEASGRDVAVVADDFIDHAGVPFVSFTLVCDKAKPPRLELTQRRFVPFASTLDTNRAWHIPIAVRWKAGKQLGRTTAVLAGATGTIELAGATACPDWVMPNADGVGYYRWSLAGAAFDKLRARKVFRALPATERLEVANVVSALVTAGELPFRRSVEIAITLIDDPERRVRQLALGTGSGWNDWLPAVVVPRYRAWVKKTYGPLARRVGFAIGKGESDDDKAMRSTILWRMAADADDAATQKQAIRLTWKWLDDRTAVAPEMVGTVMSMAAYAGDPKLYARFLAEARKAHAKNDKPERERFLGALAGFRDPELAARTRAMMLEDEFPSLETSGFLYAGTGTPEGREAAWKFLVDNYDKIHGRMPREYRSGLIYLGGDCSKAGLERTIAFFKDRTPGELQGPRTYSSFVEGQTLCIARREKDTASFVEFLTGK
jgi:alanyl aminopeptidase